MMGRTAVTSGRRRQPMDQDFESFRTSVEHVVEHHPVVMDNT